VKLVGRDGQRLSVRKSGGGIKEVYFQPSSVEIHWNECPRLRTFGTGRGRKSAPTELAATHDAFAVGLTQRCKLLVLKNYNRVDGRLKAPGCCTFIYKPNAVIAD
jgi:hypothetical protein